MKYKEFKTQVLSHAVGQLRRNVATILAVLTETEDFLSDLVNNRSGSDT